MVESTNLDSAVGELDADGRGQRRHLAQARVAQGVDALCSVQVGAQRLLLPVGGATGQRASEYQLLLPGVHVHGHTRGTPRSEPSGDDRVFVSAAVLGRDVRGWNGWNQPTLRFE